MNYHLFNPDHEIALAMNARSFVPSRNVRQMCHDLAFLPALWAEDGDCVIAEDAEYAKQAYVRLELKKKKEIQFITLKDAAVQITKNDALKPWGWNMTVCEMFRTAGMPALIIPTEKQLLMWRTLSGRATAVRLSEMMKSISHTVGIAEVCNTECMVEEYLEHYGSIVVKAPFSSSGRGVRFVDEYNEQTERWIKNIIRQQGYVTVERKYDKVLDFAVELIAEADGSIRYEGLSLFKTNGGAYTGNLLVSEDEKWDILTQYMSRENIEDIIHNVNSNLVKIIDGRFVGPFGVDMMIVMGEDEPSYRVHSSVEINMRRTMGHVALALSQCGECGVMRTVFSDGRFCLRIDES